jgi:hypothetical protein
MANDTQVSEARLALRRWAKRHPWIGSCKNFPLLHSQNDHGLERSCFSLTCVGWKPLHQPKRRRHV